MRPAVRLCAVLVVVAASLGCPPTRRPQTGPPPRPAVPPIGLLSWPRMRAHDFGCLLETRHGVRDPRWGCASPDTGPHGDPCVATEKYYAGPAFPEEAAPRVAPDVGAIWLSWEHGNLQAVTFVLRGDLGAAEARRRLELPPSGGHLPPNVQTISVQRCGPQLTCVQLVGFDHMGAGDVECPR